MRNYIVIGGSSGIGKELVRILASQGDRVHATYRENLPKEDLEAVNFQKFDVLNDHLDLSNFPEEIHGFVYCPGSINLKPFQRFTEEDFMDDYRLQVMGATRLIRELLPKLKNGEDSSIVLFSTVAVQTGFNFHSQVSASKGAIEGLTRALAAEFAPKIRVNAIAPSLTDTPLAGKLLGTPEKLEAQSKLNPMKRLGKPVDIATTAAFLLSPDSSWITGQILKVDGGFSSLK